MKLLTNRHLRISMAAISAVALLGVTACGSSTPSGAASLSSATAGAGASAAAGLSATAGSSAAAAPGTGSAIPDTSAILTAVKVDSALAAKVPAAIKSAGTLKVGSNVQSPPNNFYAADGTTVVGYEKDLMTAIAAQLGLKVTYSDMAFASLITSLAANRIDVTIAGTNDNKTRQQKIDFVDYFNSGITIMVQKGNPTGIKSSADLCGKSIAVVTGTSQEDFASAESTTCTNDGKKALQVTATDSDSQNQTQLRTGRVAAILNDLPSAVYISRTAGDGKYFQVVNQPPVDGAPYGIGVSKTNSALTGAIQGSLQKLIANGQYGAILKAWQVQSGAATKAVINGG